MTDGLSCVCHLPLAWHVQNLDEPARQAMLREAALLLNAINQMEGMHELEPSGTENRRMERLEAKLDLTLYLLARTLEPGTAPAGLPVTLAPDRVEWPDPAPPAEGAQLVLELRPSEVLPLTLRLPALALAPLPGVARVAFGAMDSALEDSLHQYVFRRHRQAIRAKTL